MYALSKLEHVLGDISIKPHIRVILAYDLDELKADNFSQEDIRTKLRVIDRMQRTYRLFNQTL